MTPHPPFARRIGLLTNPCKFCSCHRMLAKTRRFYLLTVSIKLTTPTKLACGIIRMTPHMLCKALGARYDLQIRPCARSFTFAALAAAAAVTAATFAALAPATDVSRFFFLAVLVAPACRSIPILVDTFVAPACRSIPILVGTFIFRIGRIRILDRLA